MWSTVFPQFGSVVASETADRGMGGVKGIEVVGVQTAEDSEVEPGQYGRTERTVHEKTIASGLYKKTPKNQPELCQPQRWLQMRPLR